jgi:glycerophosphoryl diester phosphodiesterase
MVLPIIVPATFRIIAHRGASAYAPENTVSAFNLAAKMGVTELETDTQLSGDGRVVLCHDLRLDRYGYRGQTVEKMRWAELASLDMGSWFSPFLFKDEKMMTLTDLFALYDHQLTYHVEIKGKAKHLPEAVYQIIAERGLQSHCIVTSFAYEALAVMRRLDSTLRLGWLVDTIDPLVLVKAKEINLFQICPHAGEVDQETIAKAHQIVSEVRAWGLTGKTTEVVKLMSKVIASGCDGMTINWPDWLRHSKS